MIIPYDYQNIAIDSIYKYFATHKEGNPVLALPTGTGKSVVIACFLQRAFRQYSQQRVIIGTHVKELVMQNYEEFKGIWPSAPAGIFSAGAKKKETWAPITFAGVQSLVKSINKFGRIDLFIIDECHLLSPDDESNYMKCINYLLAINPNMKVIGLSATPWREGIGMITDGATIFTDICINMCDMISFNWFIRQGYLCPLVPMPTTTLLNYDGVKMQGGDFNEKQLQEAVNKDEITYAALKETLEIAEKQGRKHWLIFGAGLEHVAKIEEMLTYLGVSCRTVHSKMGKERDVNIREWKEGKFTAIINNGILTTGINFKQIDLIVVLRPTASSKLWVQILGRGTRTYYAPGFDLTTQQGRIDAIMASDKKNCLVLDFARNSKRLGPINDPVIPRKKGEGTGEVPIKECPCCGVYNHISARHCGGVSKSDPKFLGNEGCGTEFEFRVQIVETASTDVLVRPDALPVVETFPVHQTTYSRHVSRKEGKPDSVKVTYFCGARKFSEYVLFDHQGFGQRKARQWWSLRSSLPVPASVAEALEMLEKTESPTHIKVRTDSDFPEIRDVCFTGEFATAPLTDDIPF